MLNFEFYNPTKIIFGAETVARLADLVPAKARVLILYGGSSAKKNGTLDEVKAALGTRVLQEFGGIEPNPGYETLMPAIEQVRREKIDFLLAVGGGSVIDGTKLVAAAVKFDGDPWEILLKHGKNVNEAIPFGTVLTLPATGSEMNSGAVITRKEMQAKLAFLSPRVFPQFSILDPTKTSTLPPRQIANGVADAFVHVVEQYLTYPAQGLVQDRFAEGLLQTLIEVGPKALSMVEDYDTRANLMWVAALALNGLIGAGVPQDWATHMIGHELTAFYGLDHAESLAVVLPGLWRFKLEQKRAKLTQYGRRVWKVKTAEKAIAKTEKFFKLLGMPTRLKAYQISAEEAAEKVRARFAARGDKFGEHADIGAEAAAEILRGRG